MRHFISHPQLYGGQYIYELCPRRSGAESNSSRTTCGYNSLSRIPGHHGGRASRPRTRSLRVHSKLEWERRTAGRLLQLSTVCPRVVILTILNIHQPRISRGGIQVLNIRASRITILALNVVNQKLQTYLVDSFTNMAMALNKLFMMGKYC
ncbi:hypothetical protein BGX38DRAFT_1166616 [Terfezia claveryi]|nr:hypothetical protein BGX38DRAFT_1166616 [Terfezia claveryi]